jgi:tetratricopeptide (TPR) repeat protein
MLQIGPLEKLLYKPSVSLRGHYWRTGIEMFKANPLFGVGLDRYGAYFKEYREVDYSLTYGYQITSTNAHNTFIQFFATGGIFLGLSYLMLNGYILKRAIMALKITNGNNRILILGVFSAWIAYHAQSLISIDNIGLSVWGWVLGGAVIGLSRTGNQDNEVMSKAPKRAKNITTFNLRQTFISSIAVAITLFAVVPLYQAEKNMFETRMRFNPTVPESKTALYEFATKTLNSQLLEPGYKITSGNYLVASGFSVEGLNILKEVIKTDPRNLDALTSLSEFNQQLGDIEEIIKYRLQIAQYDPFNATNYLQLGRSYKLTGDVAKMNEMRSKILSFAPNTEEAKQAISELN